MKRYFLNCAVAAAVVALVGCAAARQPVPGSPEPIQSVVSLGVINIVPAPVVDYSVKAMPELPTFTLPSFVSSPSAIPSNPAGLEMERGSASWYGPGFHGRRTASGERYDMHALTAAHKTLPFGTMVRVKSLVNGREVLVRITDRGPFTRNRVIDLSRAAAAELDMLGLGFKQVVLMLVEGEVVSKPAPVIKGRRR